MPYLFICLRMLIIVFLILMFSCLCVISVPPRLPLFSLFWSLCLISEASFRCLRILLPGSYLGVGLRKLTGSTEVRLSTVGFIVEEYGWGCFVAESLANQHL